MRPNTILAILVIFTFCIKMMYGGGIRNPTNEQIIAEIEPALAQIGYNDLAGKTEFAGTLSLLARASNCFMYVTPVAPQGWSQDAIKAQLQDGMKQYFVYNGKISNDRQNTFNAMTSLYIRKFLAYLGFSSSRYIPVISLVTLGSCEVENKDWSLIPSVQFKRITLIGLL